MKIGVISDTHGHFDPGIPGLFADVEHILHGGDVGHYSILTQLEQIAPVTAVLGNNDFGFDLRETEVVALGGLKFLIHHIVTPASPGEALRARLEREKPDVVVFGHTHKPFIGRVGRALFFNPGYAGRPRFNLERSVALIRIADGEITTEIVAL
ncbi:MAG TPA: metallophosphoesterase family protein [Verrucomicrobiae bacterium]|jgi:putative phosphoesterase